MSGWLTGGRKNSFASSFSEVTEKGRGVNNPKAIQQQALKDAQKWDRKKAAEAAKEATKAEQKAGKKGVSMDVTLLMALPPGQRGKHEVKFTGNNKQIQKEIERLTRMGYQDVGVKASRPAK